jgi:hypothetical protein
MQDSPNPQSNQQHFRPRFGGVFFRPNFWELVSISVSEGGPWLVRARDRLLVGVRGRRRAARWGGAVELCHSMRGVVHNFMSDMNF